MILSSDYQYFVTVVLLILLLCVSCKNFSSKPLDILERIIYCNAYTSITCIFVILLSFRISLDILDVAMLYVAISFTASIAFLKFLPMIKK